MRFTYISITALVIFVFSISVVYTDDRTQLKLSTTINKKAEPKEEVDIDRVIDALTLIVYYKQWERNQEALQQALERRFGFRSHGDPFAFKSKMLKDFLEKDDLTREEFNSSIRDLENALEELKHEYP